jgi:hypothetical protein
LDFNVRAVSGLRLARIACSLLPLLALNACGKTYTCTIYGTIGGFKVLIDQVQVKSRAECNRLVAQYGG